MSSLCQVRRKLDSERALVRQVVQKLKSGLQRFAVRFAVSDDDMRFHIGFPNYKIIKLLSIFYNFLFPAAARLNYWGSNNAEVLYLG